MPRDAAESVFAEDEPTTTRPMTNCRVIVHGHSLPVVAAVRGGAKRAHPSQYDAGVVA